MLRKDEHSDVRPSVGSLAAIMGPDRARQYLKAETVRKSVLAKTALRRHGESEAAFVRSGTGQRHRITSKESRARSKLARSTV